MDNIAKIMQYEVKQIDKCKLKVGPYLVKLQLPSTEVKQCNGPILIIYRVAIEDQTVSLNREILLYMY